MILDRISSNLIQLRCQRPVLRRHRRRRIHRGRAEPRLRLRQVAQPAASVRAAPPPLQVRRTGISSNRDRYFDWSHENLSLA